MVRVCAVRSIDGGSWWPVDVAIKLEFASGGSVGVGRTGIVAVAPEDLVQVIEAAKQLRVSLRGLPNIVRCVEKLIGCPGDFWVGTGNEMRELEWGVLVAVHLTRAGGGIGGIEAARSSRRLDAHSHTAWLIIEVV